MGHAGADGVAAGNQVVCPPGVDQELGFGGAGMPGDDEGALFLGGAGGEYFPGVKVGGAGFYQAGVTVVFDDGECEVSDGGEHRGSGADHQPALAVQDAQESTVAGLRALGCGEDRDLFRGDEVPQGSFHVVYVPLVGKDDEGAAAVFDYFHGEGRECRRPVVAGEDLPGGPGGLAP